MQFAVQISVVVGLPIGSLEKLTDENGCVDTFLGMARWFAICVPIGPRASRMYCYSPLLGEGVLLFELSAKRHEIGQLSSRIETSKDQFFGGDGPSRKSNESLRLSSESYSTNVTINITTTQFISNNFVIILSYNACEKDASACNLRSLLSFILRIIFITAGPSGIFYQLENLVGKFHPFCLYNRIFPFRLLRIPFYLFHSYRLLLSLLSFIILSSSKIILNYSFHPLLY